MAWSSRFEFEQFSGLHFEELGDRSERRYLHVLATGQDVIERCARDLVPSFSNPEVVRRFITLLAYQSGNVLPKRTKIRFISFGFAYSL
jgi:hypothetical protein